MGVFQQPARSWVFAENEDGVMAAEAEGLGKAGPDGVGVHLGDKYRRDSYSWSKQHSSLFPGLSLERKTGQRCILNIYFRPYHGRFFVALPFN